MVEFLSKLLGLTSITLFISLIFYWLSRSSNNRRLFYYGLVFILLSLAIVGFEWTRTKYELKDYSLKQIVIRECYVDTQYNVTIITDDKSVYTFNSALLWRLGLETDIAKSICAQKMLKIWINNNNEISGIESNQFSVPLEVGVAVDNSKHNFSILAPMFGLPGLLLALSALWYDWKGEKINFNF